MYLYLVQHAASMSKEEDASRSLSEKGIEDIRKISGFVQGMNIKVTHILHSGKMRALQTAQILEEHITDDMGVLGTDGLLPMDEPEIWHKRLNEMSENTMLVGHLPHLSKLSVLLLCNNKKEEIINFEMGGIVCLKRSEDRNWTVDWIIKPGMLK
ncbi:MAG: phosphohistidine phosphatase SixA [Nitrospirae bacterium]|nr:phosphohistidine phosphatase SixA [Nitrospirota bacterium]